MNVSNNVLATYNYQTPLHDVLSSGGDMVIRLQSDSSITHRGFRMVVTAEDIPERMITFNLCHLNKISGIFQISEPASNFLRCTPTADDVTPTIELSAEAARLDLATPNYPHTNYENSHDCAWVVSSEDGAPIRVTVASIGVKETERASDHTI